MNETVFRNQSVAGDQLSEVVRNLFGYVNYSVKITAHNSAGSSPWSDLLTVETQIGGRFILKPFAVKMDSLIITGNHQFWMECYMYLSCLFDFLQMCTSAST